MATKFTVMRRLFFSCQKNIFSKVVRNAGRPQYIQNSRLANKPAPLTRTPWSEFSSRQLNLSNPTKIGIARGISYAFGFGLICAQKDDFKDEKLVGLSENGFFLKEIADNFINNSYENATEQSEESINSAECESITSFQAEDNKEYTEEPQTIFKDTSFLEEVAEKNDSLATNEEELRTERDWSLFNNIINSLSEETQSLFTGLSQDFEVVSHVSSAKQETSRNDEGDYSHINSNFRQIQSFDLNEDMSPDSISFKPMDEEFWTLLNFFLENNPDFILKDKVFLEKLQSYFNIST